MDPLTFASSQNEESDFAAERRWESEGGNRENFNRHCVMIGRKTPPPRGTLKAFCYEVNGTCTKSNSAK
jgi:hypothetical protein